MQLFWLSASVIFTLCPYQPGYTACYCAADPFAIAPATTGPNTLASCHACPACLAPVNHVFLVPGTAQASANPAISEHVVLPCLNMLLHTIGCGTTIQTTATPPVSTDQQGANVGQGSQAPPPAAGDTPLAS